MIHQARVSAAKEARLLKRLEEAEVQLAAEKSKKYH